MCVRTECVEHSALHAPSVPEQCRQDTRSDPVLASRERQAVQRVSGEEEGKGGGGGGERAIGIRRRLHRCI